MTKIKISIKNFDKLKRLKKTLETYSLGYTAFVGSNSPVAKFHTEGTNKMPKRDPLIEPNKTPERIKEYKKIIMNNISSGVHASQAMQIIADNIRENTYKVMSTGNNGTWQPYSEIRAKERRRKGLTTDVVNLEDSGITKKSIKAEVRQKT